MEGDWVERSGRIFEWDLEDLLHRLATSTPERAEPPRDLRMRVRRMRTRGRRRVALALLAVGVFVLVSVVIRA